MFQFNQDEPRMAAMRRARLFWISVTRTINELIAASTWPACSGKDRTLWEHRRVQRARKQFLFVRRSFDPDIFTSAPSAPLFTIAVPHVGSDASCRSIAAHTWEEMGRGRGRRR